MGKLYDSEKDAVSDGTQVSHVLNQSSGLKAGKRAEFRQARGHCYLSRKATQIRPERDRATELTTPSEGPFRSANHPVTSRVSDRGSGDGQTDELDGVSNLVQITVLWARTGFDQPYGDNVRRGLPASRSCPAGCVARGLEKGLFSLLWGVRIASSNYIRRDPALRREIRAPGIKVEFTGDKLAVSFGPSTTDGVLVAYRLGSLDWQFSNVTADATYQFVGNWTELNDEEIREKKIFEMRVQIAGVATANNAELTVPPKFDKKVEIIGGSIASGQYGTYETISSWAYLFVAGLGNVEHTITAYPGACLTDKACYGGDVHGMTWYWHQASDPGSRAHQFYGNEPERWDVTAEQPADLVLIQMGGNDFRHPNEVPGKDFYHAYVDLIEDIHSAWPHAVVLIVSQWGSFVRKGMTHQPTQVYEEEAKKVHEHFLDRGFVYYFDTTGILQYNDINPKNHPTDVGHIKLASHLLQWVRLVLRWKLEPLGEVQHGTLYWNDQQEY
ncbi:acetylxylan esterase [Penicillium brasilianum]|uniref:Acetylxylan esterase n=1 Tax=Penicillium brasilianum TaxID=104259 RepID=A0A1S9RT64_PENBI|nr:acetylxylan esterase [Penicillium brasilianum]